MFINQIFKGLKDSCKVCGQTPCNCTHISEGKVRLDPKCWKGKKIGNPKTKMKGGVRVNNCVPKEGVAEAANAAQQAAIAISMKKAGKTPKKKSVKEGMGDVDMVLRDIVSGEMDPYTVMTRPQGPEEEYVANLLQKAYDDVAIDHRLHPDDDFEEILNIVVNNLAHDYGLK